MTPFLLEGTAIVTGAANGIGRASALALAKAGADVAVIDIEDAPLKPLGEEIAAAGQRALPIHADCTDAEAMTAAVRRVEDELSPVTILFNNVGQSARQDASLFLDSEEETWHRVLDVSLLTTMRMTRLVAPAMVARGAGRIVNMSTESAFYGDAGLADYAAAKMGVIGLTRSLARELAPSGVGVNAVCPGAIRTRAHQHLPRDVLDRIIETVPMGFVAEPEDVANVVVFLASPAARYITGQSILIDGGRWMI